MIKLNQAIEIINKQTPSVKLETVKTKDSLGRLLPKSLTSTIESPPFSKAAMDGYAVQSTDTSREFTILETIGAGEIPSKTVQQGECVKIMTGAMMPEGADKVIRVEYTGRNGTVMTIKQNERGTNVIFRAENLKIGDPVLSPGIIGAKELGIIASLGLSEIEVVKKPVMGVITTGSELKNPGEKLQSGEIYNSNGFQMCAQITENGGIPKYYGIVKDDRISLSNTIKDALKNCDVLLLSGGVSKGEFDYVPEILQENGVEPLFHRVAIKPGRPTFFGKNKDTYIFGLPGNPVSSFVVFEVMVKSLLYRMAGLEYKPMLFKGTLSKTLHRKDTERTEFYPVIIEGDIIRPIKYLGSSHLNALADANGLLSISTGTEELKEGEQVDVRPL